MAVYYINGTSNSGSTFGQSGYFYPLYLTAAEANAASANTAGTSHPHTFEEVANITFYMPTTGATHAAATPPDPNTYSDTVYVSYTSPIAETDILSIGEGVTAGDTFDTWRKKTNDIGREAITNKSLATSIDTRLTRLLTTTGGAENIVTLTDDGTIVANKTFTGQVSFSGATTLSDGVGVGSTGKIHVSGNKFKFNRDVDLDEAGANLKASQIEVTSGIANYNGIQYQWPSSGNAAGKILKLGGNNNLFWDTEAAVETNVTSFVAEDPSPVGIIAPWAKTNLPSNNKWLLCDGQQYSRDDYEELFSAIGTTYGVGDGSTTFNVPDLRARVPVGLGIGIPDANSLNASFDTLGSTTYKIVDNNDAVIESGLGAEYRHTIATDEMPVHGHAIPTRWDDGNNSGSSTTGSEPYGSNNWTDFTVTRGGPSLSADNGAMRFRGNFMTGLAGGNSHTAATRQVNNAHTNMATAFTEGTYNTFDGSGEAAASFIGAGMMTEIPGESKLHQADGTVDTGSSGGTVEQDAMNVVQPFIVLNYIIKAKPTLIIEQNITAGNGILINDTTGTVNLLNSESSPNTNNEIELNVNSSDFEFDSGSGALKLKENRVPLDFDFRLIQGTVRNNSNRLAENSNYGDGFIDTNSLARNGPTSTEVDEMIYDSESADPTTGDVNYGNILPMTFAANVEKTIITGKYNWTSQSALEEMQFVDVIIDWKNEKIFASSIANYEHFTRSFLPKQDLLAASTDYSFTDLESGIDHNLLIGITGSSKTITKFPWPFVDGYGTQVATIKIENQTRG